jgi:hypothetical protein
MPRSAFIGFVERVMEFNSGEGTAVRCAWEMTQIRPPSRATNLSPPLDALAGITLRERRADSTAECFS